MRTLFHCFDRIDMNPFRFHDRSYRPGCKKCKPFDNNKFSRFPALNCEVTRASRHPIDALKTVVSLAPHPRPLSIFRFLFLPRLRGALPPLPPVQPTIPPEDPPQNLEISSPLPNLYPLLRCQPKRVLWLDVKRVVPGVDVTQYAVDPIFRGRMAIGLQQP